MNALSSFIMEGLLEELELLGAVVQTQSFVRAGERFGLTQSGSSRAIARLEGRIGVRLFNRNARAVSLTEEGQRFYQSVTPLLSELNQVIDAAAGAAQRVHGRLRVNVDTIVSRDLLPSRIDAFLSRHPDVEVELVTTPELPQLVADGFDASVRFGEPGPSGLVARRLLQTRVVTCAAPSYLARYGKPRHPRELAEKHECIQFRDPRTGRPFDWEFHRDGRTLRVETHSRLLVNDGATAVQACIAGQCIAQPLELAIAPLLESGALIDLFPRWNEELFPLYVYYPAKQHLPAKVRALIDFLVEVTAKPARRPVAPQATF